MTGGDDGFGFAPPPFDAAAALQKIQRALRDMKLAERGNGFELRGRRVVELTPEGAAIQVRLARRLALTPEWDRSSVGSADALRRLLDEVKKRLVRWESEE